MKKEPEKILKATHGSSKTPLELGNVKIPCYVLEDGTRVLSRSGIQKAIGYEGKSGEMLTRFVNSKNGFSEEIVAGVNNPIPFQRIDAGGSQPVTNGHPATLFIDICNAIIDLNRAGILNEVQQEYAFFADIIVRATSKVGIIALVDEATGYQYDREKKELQAIVKALISDEILSWQEAFHLSFYKEIFRLWGIPFTDANIKRKPQFIGHITNRFVYQNMPKGIFILEKLKSKTPKTDGGNYKYRLHQSLTPETGRETLKKIIYSVEALASISDDKGRFIKLIAEKYGQKEIPFEDFEN